MCAKMAGNDKGKSIAECHGNDDTVDAVVAGTVVENVVLDAAAPCNIMPFHTMEALGLKPTQPTTRLLCLPADIDLGSASLAGLIDGIPVDIGPVRVLSTFQILRMQGNNSYPLLLGAPYMIAAEDFLVQTAATLSIEGLVVKHGKAVRFPFSQQQKREKRRALQCHSIKMHDTGDVQGADLPQPSAGPGIVSNSPEQRKGLGYNPIEIEDADHVQIAGLPQPSAGPGIVFKSPEQRRGSQDYPIEISDTVDVEVDDLPQPSACPGFASVSPEQHMGSQYNPIEILDTVDVEGDDLAQPSAGPSIVSDSLHHSAAFIESGKEKNQSTMQMLGKAYKLQIQS